MLLGIVEMPLLELQSVTKRYGSRAAIANLNLKFTAEQIYVVIGPSGCGKSTLVKVMMGLLRPDEGTVFLDETPLTSAIQVRERVGYVVQDGGLFPHLTARQNVTLVANYLGWSQPRVTQRISQLTELTRLPQDALDRYPLQLSGGQRQRVGLMRALMLDPQILLLDEPLGSYTY